MFEIYCILGFVVFPFIVYAGLIVFRALRQNHIQRKEYYRRLESAKRSEENTRKIHESWKLSE